MSVKKTVATTGEIWALWIALAVIFAVTGFAGGHYYTLWDQELTQDIQYCASAGGVLVRSIQDGRVCVAHQSSGIWHVTTVHEK